MYSSKQFLVTINYQGLYEPDIDDVAEMIQESIQDSTYWERIKKFSLGDVVDVDSQEVE